MYAISTFSYFLLLSVSIPRNFLLSVAISLIVDDPALDPLDTITTVLISYIMSKKNFVVASRTVFPGEVYFF